MLKLVEALSLVLLPLNIYTQQVDIHLERFGMPQSFFFQPIEEGAVLFSADSFPRKLRGLTALQQLKLTAKGNSIFLYKEDQLIGRFGALLFWNKNDSTPFNLYFPAYPGKKYTYNGYLKVVPKGNQLLIINQIQLDQYAYGVVYAEAGHHKSLEFLKVQAASARTYALKHYNRHQKEGFGLCDQTHCQAYKGLPPAQPLLQKAIRETSDEIIIHENGTLIEAVFSANCGGFTANSEDVWLAKVEYLRATSDYHFCEGFKNHSWHINIPKLEFLARLGNYHDIDALSFEIIPDLSGRVKKILVNEDQKYAISGEELRRLFKLKSAKFHIYESGSLLFIEGEGFGHGVGMCQDGAYYLSQQGYDYQYILKHYYQDVQLKKVREVEGVWE